MSSQKFNILFSGDPQSDLLNLCRYIDEFGASVGLPHLDIDTAALVGVIGTNQQFPWAFGKEKASPFKKVAAFTTNFVSAKPIITPFPEKEFGDLAGHQNAIVAFALSVDALHGAEINCAKRERTIVLSNRIKVSYHYWRDLIAALATATPSGHFACVSLMYEALAYQVNPDVSYDRVI